MEMARCQNGRLMVDEVDAGIHHSRMDTYWRSIVRAALDNNIQLIAATHSLECLQSLKRVFETGELASSQGEVRCVALSQLPDRKTIKAYTYPWTEFQAALSHENELR
jgi:AAA15 family ATPase/GTPase